MPVRLKYDLQAKIFNQMQASYPNEGGGFLLGTLMSDHVLIQEVIEVENVFESEEQYHRYAMTPQNWATMEDEADSRGLTLLGYYHSHPNSPAIPSEYDREHALPNFVYIITSVQPDAKGQPRAVDMRAWQLRDDRKAFETDVLTIL